MYIANKDVIIIKRQNTLRYILGFCSRLNK